MDLLITVMVDAVDGWAVSVSVGVCTVGRLNVLGCGCGGDTNNITGCGVQQRWMGGEGEGAKCNDLLITVFSTSP